MESPVASAKSLCLIFFCLSSQVAHPRDFSRELATKILIAYCTVFMSVSRPLRFLLISLRKALFTHKFSIIILSKELLGGEPRGALP